MPISTVNDQPAQVVKKDPGKNNMQLTVKHFELKHCFEKLHHSIGKSNMACKVTCGMMVVLYIDEKTFHAVNCKPLECK